MKYKCGLFALGIEVENPEAPAIGGAEDLERKARPRIVI